MNLLTLIMQVGVILVAARVVGWLFRRIRQPQVVGEMAAGILLGPSLLGWAAPRASAFLFPPDSLGYLNAASIQRNSFNLRQAQRLSIQLQRIHST